MNVVARRVVLGALAVLLVSGLGDAHAASLGVTGSTLTTADATACTTSSLTVTPTDPQLFGILGYAGARLTVPASCLGAALSATVYDTSGGATQATASASAIGSTSVVLSTSAAYGGWFQNSPSVAVTIDGWSVPAAF